jgi:hypothetical protein
VRSDLFSLQSRRRWLVAMPILVACAGCIQKTAKGDVSTYGFETWIVLCVAVGGALAVPVGWWLRKRNARFGYALLILGPLALILLAPAIWTDRVVVDSKHFERSSAMPGSINESISFDDVLGLHYHSAVERSGRRSNRKYYLDVTRKGGQVQTIALGTLFQAALEEILIRAAEKGIKVSEDHQ